MKILIALLFSILALCFTVRADTLQFNLQNPSELVTFDLQQGQAPDDLTQCGCALEDNGYDTGRYFNVPVTINGNAGSANISLLGPNFNLGPGLSVYGVPTIQCTGPDCEPFLGSIFTGSLAAPHFDLGTFKSLVECSGFEMPSCGLQSSNTTLIISDISNTPEPSSLAMLLMGIPVLWFAFRRITAKQLWK